MSNFAALPRVCAIVAAAGIVLSGCTQSIGGTAVKGPGPAGSNVPPLAESGLDQILLSIDDVGSIVGSSDLQLSSSSEDLADNSDSIDKSECLGVFYSAEQKIYDKSGWKAVRDQIIREPGDAKEHWVEQTVVLFANADKAANFLDKSRDEWKKCQQSSATTEGSDTSYNWDFGRLQEPSETMMSMDMDQQDSNNWVCQHAMGTVSNIIVEGVACANGVGDEGRQVVEQIVKNASAK